VARHEEIPKGMLMSILKDVSVQTGVPVAWLKEMFHDEWNACF